MADDQTKGSEQAEERAAAVQAAAVPPTKAHVMDVGAATIALTLPCGYVDAAGVLHQDVVLAEMTGNEEDLIMGRGALLPRLNQILTNCIRRLGTVTDRAEITRAVAGMTMADRTVAFLALRRVSLGDNYQVKVLCPNPECRYEDRYNLDLNTIEVRPMADPMQRQFVHTVGNHSVSWHVMNAADEEWLGNHGKRREDVLTLAMLARVDEIDGKPVDRAGRMREEIVRLKALPIRVRNGLRALWREHEGGVDTTVDFRCKQCGHEWKSEMDMGQPSFFFPSAP